MSTDDKPTHVSVTPAEFMLGHLIPTRRLTDEEQAAITRREDARRKGRGHKDWHLRCPMKTDGWERSK